jgi:hypothetical protein
VFGLFEQGWRRHTTPYVISVGDVLSAIGMLIVGAVEAVRGIQMIGSGIVGAIWIVTGVVQGGCWGFGMLR